MSRYGVNKVLWEVARDDAKAAAFVDAPDAFLDGCALTDDERRCLLTRDYARMFSGGAHPFLLYTFKIKLAGGFSFPLMIDHVQSLAGIDPPLDIST